MAGAMVVAIGRIAERQIIRGEMIGFDDWIVAAEVWRNGQVGRPSGGTGLHLQLAVPRNIGWLASARREPRPSAGEFCVS